MFCDKCGREQSSETKFCANCGNEIKIITVNSNKNIQNRKLEFISAGILMLITIFMLRPWIYVLITKTNGDTYSRSRTIPELILNLKLFLTEVNVYYTYGVNFTSVLITTISVVLIVLLVIYIVNICKCIYKITKRELDNRLNYYATKLSFLAAAVTILGLIIVNLFLVLRNGSFALYDFGILKAPYIVLVLSIANMLLIKFKLADKL